MRLRKQKEVQKENEFYMQLLQQALPPEQQMLQKQEKEAEEGRSLLWSCGPNKLVRFCFSKEKNDQESRFWIPPWGHCLFGHEIQNVNTVFYSGGGASASKYGICLHVLIFYVYGFFSACVYV